MKILLILCTSMLIALANSSFAQEEEPIQMRPGMLAENTRMGTSAVQPGTSREKAGVIGDSGVQGRASTKRRCPQPGTSREKAGVIGDCGVRRPGGSQPSPEATPITLP